MSFLNVLPFSSGDPIRHHDVPREQQGRFKVVARRKSIGFWRRNRSASTITEEDITERTWLLTSVITNPPKGFIEDLLDSRIRQIALFYALPTSLVLLYAAIPFPLYNSADPDKVSINFWFFLLVYYGLYNAIGLLWITKLFNLFGVNWWPASLGGVSSFLLFWSVSLCIGSLTYILKDEWGTWTLTWSLLTLFTMAGPVVFGFFYTRRMQLERFQIREAVQTHTKSIPFPLDLEVLLPRSYKRFLWFVTVLAVGLTSFAFGDTYAWIWLTTLPHSSADVVLYVYTWMTLVFCMDQLTSTIIETKLESPSLVFVFKLYYALTNQVYVRNLYARLRSPQQFAIVQSISSLSTLIITPIILTGLSYRVYALFVKSPVSLENYRRNAIRSFYLKDWAANTTMMAFLGWVTILHFGPNRPAYPYFDFTHDGINDDLYSWQLTFTASFIVWLCELGSSFMARRLIRIAFAIEVDSALREELTNYPDLLPSGVVLTMFVLMNMLSTSPISPIC